jgi:hypothetical protein
VLEPEGLLGHDPEFPSWLPAIELLVRTATDADDGVSSIGRNYKQVCQVALMSLQFIRKSYTDSNFESSRYRKLRPSNGADESMPSSWRALGTMSTVRRG